MWYLICGILNVVSFLTILIYRMKYLETQYRLRNVQKDYQEAIGITGITKSSLLQGMANSYRGIIFVDREIGTVKYKRIVNGESRIYDGVLSCVDKQLTDTWKTLWSSQEYLTNEKNKLEENKQKLLAELQKVEQDSTKLLNAASTIELDDYLNKGG